MTFVKFPYDSDDTFACATHGHMLSFKGIFNKILIQSCATRGNNYISFNYYIVLHPFCYIFHERLYVMEKIQVWTLIKIRVLVLLF